MKLYPVLLILFLAGTAYPQQAEPDTRDTWNRLMIPYRKGERWGYMDARGNLLVVPQFEEAGFLISGRARVRVNGKYGYLNAAGNYAIHPDYDAATEFEEYAKVSKAGKSFYIDPLGNPVSRETVAFRGAKCGGVIIQVSYFQRYQVDGKIGLLVHERSAPDSLTGKRKIRYDTLPGLYDEFRENGKGLVAVRAGDFWGMLDQQGQWVLPPEYAAIEFFSNARGSAVNFYGRIQKEGLWGLLDEKGAVVVPPKYESVKWYHSGLFLVKPPGRAAGYMDQYGKEFFED